MNQVTQFIETVLGAQVNKGIAIMMTLDTATGSPNAKHIKFEFPEDISKMAAKAKELDTAGLDVYLSVGLYGRDSSGVVDAKADYVIGSPCVWLDADNCKPENFLVPPKVVLQSSPNRYQVFWPLEQMVSPQQAESVVKSLSYQYRGKGSDVNGWRCNKLMRLPGTHNHKAIRVQEDGTYPEVELLKMEPEPVTLSVFGRVFEMEELGEEESVPYDGPVHEYVDIPPLHPLPGGYLWYPMFVRRWNSRTVGDRSHHISLLCSDLYRHGLDDSEILRMLSEHPVCIDKYVTINRIKADVMRFLDKLRENPPEPYRLYRAEDDTQDDDTPRIFSAFTVTKLPEPPWLIPGYMPAKAHVNLYGPSGIGKSLAVLDWAFRLALGKPWYDTPVQRIPVLYIVAEGLTVTQQRIMSWANYHQVDLERDLEPDQLMFYGQSVQLMNEVDIKKLKMDIQAHMRNAPQLIVFDTLSQCIIGANENSPEDMSRVNGVMEELRRMYACTTLLVHHTGYENDHERGHSSFPASADTRIKVESYMGQLTLDCEKQRGGEPFETVYLDFKKRDPSVLVETSRSQKMQLTDGDLRPYHVKILKTLAGSKAMSTHEVAALCAIPERRFLRYRAELELSRLLSRPSGWDKMVQLTPDGEAMYKRLNNAAPAPTQTYVQITPAEPITYGERDGVLTLF
jgi:KaiC/GvpD/RAD55 family RecA-like ATPase